VYAGKDHHFVGVLVVKDEHDVPHEDESQEVADYYRELLGIVEDVNREVETHHDETE